MKSFDQQASAFHQTADGAPDQAGTMVAGGPDLVRVIIVAGRKKELEAVRTIVSAYGAQPRLWRPFLPDSPRTIAVEAQQIIAQEGLISELVDLGDDLCDRIREAAQKNEIVLLLADPWTLHLEVYARQLKPYDQLYILNCTLLMIWNSRDDETNQRTLELEQILSRVFRNKMHVAPPGHIFKGVDSRAELLAHLARVITETKMRIIEFTPRHRRAENAVVQDEATRQGIDVSNRAVLQGPAGEQP